MGTPALHQSAVPGTITFQANALRYSGPGAGVPFTQNATTFQSETIWGTAGVWSNLWLRVTTNTRDGSSTMTAMVNLAFVNQEVVVPALTTGSFEDTSNSDVVAAGDRLQYVTFSNHSVAATLGYNISIIQTLFTPTAAGERVYRIVSSTNSTDGTGVYPCMTGLSKLSTEPPLQSHFPAGTFRNATTRVRVNIGGSASRMRLRLNEADTAITLLIPAGQTGTFDDTSTELTVVDRDRVNWDWQDNAGILIALDHIALDFVTPLFFGGGVVVSAPVTLLGSVSSSDARKDGFTSHSGPHKQVISESNVQADALVTDTWGGLVAHIASNGQTGTCELLGRINGADAGFQITVPALGTGVIESVGEGVPVTPHSQLSVRRRANGTSPTALEYHSHNFFVVPPALPDQSFTPPPSTARTIRRQRTMPHLTSEQLWIFYKRFQLDLETGTALLEGQGEDPQVMLEWSDDNGNTWSQEKWRTVGRTADDTERVLWRRLGRSRDRIFRITVTDPVKWAFIDAYLELEKGTS